MNRQTTLSGFRQLRRKAKVGNADDNFLERGSLMMHLNLVYSSHVSILLRFAVGHVY